ncbi:hypothetical protein B5M42_020955 [Paenibacillus athensensis]|uniref:Uncharacterized protein n=1 Tax=Paenibacillus athensensis TaxID=1967502 RepID=A0A4Y8PZZ3_9BACL|nr:hypothetical protein [Paenibacillus athensensis]MCD1261274.1 hypothetical protein [Paenibacillus athensensis]
MRVIEAKVCYPINATGGLNVQIEGTSKEIYGGAADRFAVEIANAEGWNGNGRGSIGIPVRKGIDFYTRAYWFYEKR